MLISVAIDNHTRRLICDVTGLEAGFVAINQCCFEFASYCLIVFLNADASFVANSRVFLSSMHCGCSLGCFSEILAILLCFCSLPQLEIMKASLAKFHLYRFAFLS